MNDIEAWRISFYFRMIFLEPPLSYFTILFLLVKCPANIECIMTEDGIRSSSSAFLNHSINNYSWMNGSLGCSNQNLRTWKMQHLHTSPSAVWEEQNGGQRELWQSLLGVHYGAMVSDGRKADIINR